MFVYHSRKYKVNESFFDEWSPTMAYVLGFWFADGYMRKDRSYRILFFSNDLQILRSIRGAMRSTHPIRKRKDDQCWDINICSKKLFQQLERLGGIRRKSKIITFPRIPSPYMRDFIRGYFDGDGSVFFVRYTRTKDKRRARELRTNFTSGSREFLESLMKVLQYEIDLSLKKIGVFNKGSSLKLGYGLRDSAALLRDMYYKNFPIGLYRKALFVKRIPTYQKHFSRK